MTENLLSKLAVTHVSILGVYCLIRWHAFKQVGVCTLNLGVSSGAKFI